jgi:hypothetical protein
VLVVTVTLPELLVSTLKLPAAVSDIVTGLDLVPMVNDLVTKLLPL